MLIVEQGWKDLYYVDRGPDHPLETTKEDPTVYSNSILNIHSVSYSSFLLRDCCVFRCTVCRDASSGILGV